MTGDPAARPPRRSCRLPRLGPPAGSDDEHDPASCDECARELADLGEMGAGEWSDLGDVAASAPDPDLGEIVVILLVSTLAGLRDRLERDGFDSAAALVHDLVEVADDYVMRFQS
jgi:hypothetical protein